MAVKNPECPICGQRFKDGRGLSGHVQFKHDIWGEERDELVQKGMERGHSDEKPAPGRSHVRSIRDRELEIEGMLREIEERRTELEDEQSWTAYGFGGSKSKDIQARLDKLDEREENCREKLREINDMRETGDVPDAPLPEESDRMSTEDEQLMQSIKDVDPQDA